MPRKSATHTILHAQDTISEVITTLKGIKQDTLFYLPEEMYMLYNPINRKLLAREVLAQKKYQIQFFSPDHHLVDLFRQEHLEATTSENLDTPEISHKQETDTFADFFRYDTPNDFDHPLESPSISTPRPYKKSKSHSPKAISSWKYVVIGIVLALGVTTIVAAFAVPQATVTLTQSGEVFSQDFEVTFDTTISEISPEEPRIPLYRKEVTSEISQEFDATGKTESGNRATTTIVIRNETSSAQALVANTRFLSEDQKQYRTTQSISVPANGSTEAEIIADAVGEEYNIEAGRLSIPGLGSSRDVYGDLRQSITNGSTDNQTIVTQEDIDRVQTELREKISQELNQKLESSEDGRTPIQRSVSLSDVQFVDLPSVGTATEKFTVVAQSTLNGLVYDTSQVQEFVRQKITGQLLEGKELADTLEISFDDVDDAPESSRIRTRLYAEYGVVTLINTANAQEYLKGKPLSTLESYVSDTESIVEASLEVRPAFLPMFPLLKRNIIINIES